jgi:NCS2 family nucleobase:cation symporter-2
MKKLMNRPSQLIYSLDEKPPFFHLVLLGLQYTCMMFPYLIIVVILGKTQGNLTSNPISFSLIALGVATLLQCLKKGPIGSGYLAPPVISAIYFPASMAAVTQGGLALVYGMTIFAGAIEIFFSFFLNLLRKYFPPLVCGLIILAVGLQLGLLAISQIFSVKDYESSNFNLHLLASGATLLTMVVLTIWAKGMWRLLSPFFWRGRWLYPLLHLFSHPFFPRGPLCILGGIAKHFWNFLRLLL